MKDNTDAPLLNLLGTPLHEMSEGELRQTVSELRDASSSATAMKQKLVKKKVAKKAAKKVDLSDLI